MSVQAKWNMCCPKCRRANYIDIAATMWVRLTKNGTDPTSAFDGSCKWSGTSRARCNHCQYIGTASNFELAIRTGT
ncbi:MAG TPA: hypothetical protein VGJ01_02495 [Pseudolabrys sp.]